MALSQTRRGTVIALPQTAYGTPRTSTEVATSGSAIECDITIPESAVELFERDAMRSDIDHTLPRVAGSKYGTTFSMRYPLRGWTTTAPGSISSNPDGTKVPCFGAFHSLLNGALFNASTLAGYGYASGAVVGSGSDSDTVKIDYTSTASNLFKTGGGLILEDADGDYRMGFIKTVTDGGGSADHTVELAVPLTETGSDFTAPSDGTDTFGTITTYPEAPSSSPAGVTFLWRSADSATQLLIESAVCQSISLSLDPKGQVMVDATVVARRIVSDTSTEASLAYTYDGATDVPVLPPATGNNAARLVFLDGATAKAFDVESFSVELSSEIKPILSHGAPEGCAGVIPTGYDITVSFTALLGNSGPFDTTGAGSPPLSIETSTPAIQLQIGSKPGQMLGILIPKAINVEVPKMEDRDGVLAVSYVCKPGNYTGDSATGSGGNSNFRIALG